jgi:hypothetical protein
LGPQQLRALMAPFPNVLTCNRRDSAQPAG